MAYLVSFVQRLKLCSARRYPTGPNILTAILTADLYPTQVYWRKTFFKAKRLVMSDFLNDTHWFKLILSTNLMSNVTSNIL